MTLLSPDLRLHDRFTLVERIGAGGMSEVWRASDDVLGRAVAVKALAAPLAADPALRRTTWREARAAAQLTHPNVTQVYDYGEATLPGGAAIGYLVMELVAGQSLAERLAAGALPWPQAVSVVRQVAAALAAAHRIGVIHRDVKPGNVMLTPTGVKVLDFGIAAAGGWADTDPGRLAGTPTYTAPERLDVAAPAEPASDVYSLGVLCFEALTGSPPAVLRDWSAAAAAHSARSAAPRPEVPGLPDEVARLCQACLAADPGLRPSAERVATDLAGVGGESEGPAPAGAPGPAAATAGSTAPALARYAVGSATPPGHRSAPASQTRVDGPEPPDRRGRRLALLTGVAAAVIVLVAGLVLALAALRSGDPGPSGDPGGAGQVASQPSPSPVPPTGTAGAADGLAEAAGAFDAALSRAFEAGEITQRALADLQDKLDDVREAADEGNVDERDEERREEAEDLREEIDELREDGEISQSIADDLADLVDSLFIE